MSNTASLDDFRRLIDGCEKREQIRSGGTREDARRRLAHRMGVLPGTLYNIARDRLKRLDHLVRDRLTAYAVRDLQETIGRLSHDMDMARQMGAHPMSPRMGEIEKHLAALKELLSEAKIGEGEP